MALEPFRLTGTATKCPYLRCMLPSTLHPAPWGLQPVCPASGQQRAACCCRSTRASPPPACSSAHPQRLARRSPGTRRRGHAQRPRRLPAGPMRPARRLCGGCRPCRTGSVAEVSMRACPGLESLGPHLAAVLLQGPCRSSADQVPAPAPYSGGPAHEHLLQRVSLRVTAATFVPRRSHGRCKA